MSPFIWSRELDISSRFFLGARMRSRRKAEVLFSTVSVRSVVNFFFAAGEEADC